MAVNEPIRETGPYVGDDVLVELPFDFETFAASDISVVVTTTATGAQEVLTRNTDYTVTLNADQSASPGGEVTLEDPLATGTTATVYGDAMDYTRTGDIITNPGGFFPAIVNDALDRVHIALLQLKALADRGVKVRQGEDGLTLPSIAERAGKVFGFTAGGAATAITLDDSLDGSLRADMADDAAAKGSDLLHFGYDIGYSAGSVGHRLDNAVFLGSPPFNAAQDGTTDDTVALQAAVDYCAANGWPDLVITGPVKVTASVMIDRLVDTMEDDFRIVGMGPEAGFIVTSGVTIFDSTLTVTTAPQSERVRLFNLRFEASSIAINAYVFSKKFLRVSAQGCFFNLIRWCTSDIYLQSHMINYSTLLYCAPNFMNGAGSYDCSFSGNEIKGGSTVFRSIDTTYGTLGFRFLNNLVEGLQDSIVKATGVSNATVGYNHLEGNAGPYEFNFFAGVLAGTSATVISNFAINPGGPLFYWGTMDRVVSIGNSCGSPNPGSGTTMHSNASAATEFISIGDAASTVSSDALTARLGDGVLTRGRSVRSRVVLAYSASITPSAPAGNVFVITVTNNSNFTINGAGSATTGQQITFTIRNTTAGAIGTLTWAADYKLASWTQPGAGTSRSITFEYDGLNWIEVSRTPADVPV